MPTLTLNSPAKLNLLLAVTGRRQDGFHELVSVVAPLEWGDTLTVEIGEGDDAGKEASATNKNTRIIRGEGAPDRTGEAGVFSLTCDDPAVPVDATNLVVKAAEAFRAATGWCGTARFKLKKRIPMGAGLGGGSSNAAAALRGLNQLTGEPLTRTELAAVAATVGSDCALFLHDGPVVMRGRGERVEDLPPAAAAWLRGQSVLVFKPAFAISTAWAYGRLAAAAPASYVSAAEAEARLAGWTMGAGPGVSTDAFSAGAMKELFFNNMEPPAFAKFPALPLLLERLHRDFGLVARMSGSGSACFAMLPGGDVDPRILETIERLWGASVFAVQTHFP